MPSVTLADPTEPFRRQRLAELNPGIGKVELELRHGVVLDTKELAASFEVIGYMSPLVVVRRRSDGKVGSMEFQHEPRFYFNWKADGDGN
jgi:hypothetical protein